MVMHVILISFPFLIRHIFSPAVIRLSTGRKMRSFEGRGKTMLANLLIFLLTEYIQLFQTWKWSDCVEVNRRESGSNFMFVCEKGCTSTAPSKGGYIFKRTITLEIGDTPPQNWPFCSWKLLRCQTTAYSCREKLLKCVHRSDYSK